MKSGVPFFFHFAFFNETVPLLHFKHFIRDEKNSENAENVGTLFMKLYVIFLP